MGKIMNMDVLILCEGTYPYVRGGVSSWIHQLIKGLPDIKFGILFMGSQREDYGDIRYELPDNLVYRKEFYLFDKLDLPDVRSIDLKGKFYNEIKHIHQYLGNDINKEFKDALLDVMKKFSLEDFLYSTTAWQYIEDKYLENHSQESFLDFFWTIRNMHLPLWAIFRELEDIQIPKLLHTPSTGYAGFVGALLNTKYQIPLLLTEHGIYVRERKIDLLTSELFDSDVPNIIKSDSGNTIKEIWDKFFIRLGQYCYSASNEIFSLYSKAKDIQIEYGADEKRCRVVPNGVNVDRLKSCLKKRDEKLPKVVGLIGRVVPIKDIKTFIKSMKIVIEKMPEAEGWIVGPTEEDPTYFKECQNLVEVLEIKDNIKFLGFQNILDIFPKIAINTLTSISEGMPLSVLEGFAAGVPSVTTDVGACQDLIYGGLNEEDLALGKAGFICRVSDSKDIADKYIKLLTDEKLWRECQKTALTRVNKYYTEKIFLDDYKKIYEKYL
jgi:glycosyltransferase involved in cell wall biosynthesis